MLPAFCFMFLRVCGLQSEKIGLMECLCAAVSGRPMVKFESGFTVETVFDGSKLGIEPHTVEVLPNGELLILDSANSNIYRISSSLSLCKWVLCGLEINCWF